MITISCGVGRLHICIFWLNKPKPNKDVNIFLWTQTNVQIVQSGSDRNEKLWIWANWWVWRVAATCLHPSLISIENWQILFRLRTQLSVRRRWPASILSSILHILLTIQINPLLGSTEYWISIQKVFVFNQRTKAPHHRAAFTIEFSEFEYSVQYSVQ